MADNKDLGVQYDGQQGASTIKSSRVNSILLSAHKNGYHHNNSHSAILLQHGTTQPFEPKNGINETTLSEQDTSKTGGQIVGPQTNVIWSTTRNMWPQQLLNSNDGLGPQASLIHWTILIGALLTIILLIMLILRKLLASTFPSYHWMLAKQTLKSSSKQQLGSTGVAPDCCSALPYACRMPSQTSGPHRQMPPGPTGSLLIETLDYHKANPGGRRPHHLCYAWRNHNQQAPVLDSSALSPTFHNASSSSGLHRIIANTNGCHLLMGASNSKFNTDASQDVYMEPTSQVSNSSSTQRRHQMQRPHNNNNSNDHDLNISNYNTLNSSYYGNPVTIREDYHKGFVLNHDFVPAPPKRQTEIYQSSTTRKAKVCRRKSNKRSLGEASSHENLAAESGQLPAGEHSNRPSGRTCQLNNDNNDSRSVSISSSDESPSVQSTTAQMLSNAASSSFEQPFEFEVSPALNSSNQVANLDSSSVQASPANLAGKVRNNKLLATQTVQSQPNSPMFANQFSNRPSNHKYRKNSSRSQRHVFSRGQSNSEFQGSESQNTDLIDSQEVDLSKNSQTVTCHLSSNDCDTNEDRHFYEEINQHESNN